MKLGRMDHRNLATFENATRQRSILGRQQGSDDAAYPQVASLFPVAPNKTDQIETLQRNAKTKYSKVIGQQVSESLGSVSLSRDHVPCLCICRLNLGETFGFCAIV
jgi:hypothetical protein